MSSARPFECDCRCAPECTPEACAGKMAGNALSCGGGVHRVRFNPTCHPCAGADVVVDTKTIAVVCRSCGSDVERHPLLEPAGPRGLPSCVVAHFPRAHEVDHGDHEARRAHDAGGRHAELTTRERAWGCARPYRHTYRHLKCGMTSTIRFADMALAIARHGHRHPTDEQAHSIHRKGLLCQACNELLPPGDFVWVDSHGRDLGKVGT